MNKTKTDNYPYYSFDYKGIRIDPYRVMYQYGMTHPAQQHAFKKLLRAGTGHKPLEQDIQEVIDTLTRWQAMVEEDRDQPLVPGQRVHLQTGTIFKR